MPSKLSRQVGAQLLVWLEKQKLSNKKAAGLFNQPGTFISKRARGDVNMTLKSVEELFGTLGADVVITVKKKP